MENTQKERTVKMVEMFLENGFNASEVAREAKLSRENWAVV